MYYLDTPIADEWGYESYAIAKYQLKEEVIAHSPNIIDLVEAGDYVNGCEVTQVTTTQLIVRDENGLSMWEKKWAERIIKHIVTKEQFNSIKYEVI